MNVKIVTARRYTIYSQRIVSGCLQVNKRFMRNGKAERCPPCFGDILTTIQWKRTQPHVVFVR